VLLFSESGRFLRILLSIEYLIGNSTIMSWDQDEPINSKPKEPRKSPPRKPLGWRKLKFILPNGNGLTEDGYHYLEDMARVGCTRAEIAASLGIGRDTLYLYEKADPRITNIIETEHEVGRQELRMMQKRAAKKGSNAMLIWLGKQWLSQSDKAEFRNTHDTQHSLENIDVSKLSTAEAAQFQALIRKAAGVEPISGTAPPGVLPPDKRNDDPHHKLLRTKGIKDREGK
jgi:hypothetical protein